MKEVPPLPGEEALYKWIGSVLDAADNDPGVKQTLKETAIAAERELIEPFFQWRNNGRAAGNGWNSPVNNARMGNRLPQPHRDRQVEHVRQPAGGNEVHLHGRSTARASNSMGSNSYTSDLPERAVPPVKGFWSLTAVQRVSTCSTRTR